jgi:hypothetical protein
MAVYVIIIIIIIITIITLPRDGATRRVLDLFVCSLCLVCCAPRCSQLSVLFLNALKFPRMLQTHVRIEGIHTIAAVSPTNFNI